MTSLLPLNRTGQNASNEIALEAEEDYQRNNHREEGGRGQQLPAGTLRADQVGECHGHRGELLRAADVYKRDQVVVPDPKELEDDQRGESRHRQRQHDAEKDGERSSAIDLRRLEKVGGKCPEEIREQVDRKRQAIPSVDEPETQETNIVWSESQLHKQFQDGHKGRLQWNSQHPNQREEEKIPTPELHPGEGVRRECGDRHRDHSGGDRDHEAVEKALAKVAAV